MNLSGLAPLSKLKLNQKGIGLIELIVGSSISLVALMLLTSMQHQMAKNTRNAKIKLTMQTLASSMDMILASPDFLEDSSSNLNLIRNSEWVHKPLLTSGYTFNPQSLIEQAGYKIFSRGGFQYSGTRESPMFFNEYGQPCSSLSLACPIEVTSRSTFSCSLSSCVVGRDTNEIIFDYSIKAPLDYSQLKPKESVLSRQVAVSMYLERKVAANEQIENLLLVTNRIHTINTVVRYSSSSSSSSSNRDDGNGEGNNSSGKGSSGGSSGHCGDGPGSTGPPGRNY